MKALPHLSTLFTQLTRGCHLSPEDEPCFSALSADFGAYAEYFEPLGFQLIRHEREFFFFAPSDPEKVPETLPRIAVFAFILVDHAANQGQPIEEFILGRNFLLSALPHFSLERYSALLRQVDETLLVINGEILTDVDFRSMLAYHKDHKADLTVAVMSEFLQLVQSVIRRRRGDRSDSDW